MCGLAGLIATAATPADTLQAQAGAMIAALRHRGPDDGGLWTDAGSGLVLAHRRLAILDLSAAGHQPMVSAAGRWAIVFNGEIYNHLDLRAALQAEGAAPAWRGHSDTETLLAAVEAWGCEGMLARSVGMFALALWDRQQRELWLARDRMGEKPLYYGWQDGQLLFASELKALRAHPNFTADIDREALALMTRYSYVPNPHCIYRGFRKLAPGHCLRLPLAGLAPGRLPAPQAYWTPWPALEAGLDAKPGDEAAAIDALDALLQRAVGQQCLSDVPLGALLSGGVDSSLIVSLMQARSTQPVRTFTIGFEEKAFDESAHARAVAAHLGTRHTELLVSPRAALELIPELPRLFDEPLGDYSVIPTYLVAKLARTQVTVALSGDGGDELFNGYTRYVDTERRWRRLQALPLALRRGLSAVLQGLAPTPRARRAAEVLALPDFAALYEYTQAYWRAPLRPPANDRADTGIPPDLAGRLDPWLWMVASDLALYLPEHILAKVDRAAMAVSLETRAPLLDHRVVEFALRQPARFRRRDDQGKWLLRQVLYRRVPKALIERPKMGFTVPIAAWLRGPLRDWAEDLLSARALAAQGFDADAVRREWQRYLAGDDRPAQYLWNLLTACQWLRAAA